MNSEKKTSLDVETKLKLLISLINDEGRDKLSTSIDKLLTRLVEYTDSHGSIISDYFTRAITYVPCKASIYAYILAKYYEKTKSNIVKEILSNVYTTLGEEKEGI
jgi:hypothetical protein